MRKMYDWKCEMCNNEFEGMFRPDVKIIACPKCLGNSFKIFPKKAPTFNLTYDPKKDSVDWNGNKSRYYDEYNAAKARGEKVRLPEQGE